MLLTALQCACLCWEIPPPFAKPHVTTSVNTHSSQALHFVNCVKKCWVLRFGELFKIDFAALFLFEFISCPWISSKFSKSRKSENLKARDGLGICGIFMLDKWILHRLKCQVIIWYYIGAINSHLLPIFRWTRGWWWHFKLGVVRGPFANT